MKTRIIIEVETSKMNPVYNTDDADEWTEENLCTEDTDKEFHDAIHKYIEEYFTEGRLEEDLMEDPTSYGLEAYPEEYDSFNDFGEVKISISQDIIDDKTDRKKEEVKPNSSQD